MSWIKANISSLILFVLAIGMAGYALFTVTDSLKEKCVFVSLEDKASIEFPSLKMTGPASYRSFAKDCGYLEPRPVEE